MYAHLGLTSVAVLVSTMAAPFQRCADAAEEPPWIAVRIAAGCQGLVFEPPTESAGRPSVPPANGAQVLDHVRSAEPCLRGLQRIERVLDAAEWVRPLLRREILQQLRAPSFLSSAPVP